MATVTDFGIDFTKIGPAVGAPFPDVVLPDQHGKTVSLHEVRAGRRALVVFHRSAEWWPFCKTQLVELQRSLPDFEREHIAIFAISYDAVDILRGFAEKYGITYTLLSDAGSRVIRELGLLNDCVGEQHAAYGIPKQDRHRGLPYPGVFLLDARGDVIQKRFNQSYRERETGVGILEQGFGIASSVHGPEAHGQTEGVKVRAYLDSPTYRFFQRLWLMLELHVDAGLHIYGRPIPEGYMPLTIDVAPVSGMVVGEPIWPPPHPYRVELLDEELPVYEGEVVVSLPVTLTEEGDDQTLHVTLRYQACSAADCFLPSTVKLQLPLNAADHVERPRRRWGSCGVTMMAS